MRCARPWQCVRREPSHRRDLEGDIPEIGECWSACSSRIGIRRAAEDAPGHREIALRELIRAAAVKAVIRAGEPRAAIIRIAAPKAAIRAGEPRAAIIRTAVHKAAIRAGEPRAAIIRTAAPRAAVIRAAAARTADFPDGAAALPAAMP